MNRVKQQLSILTPIIYTFILCLVLLTISRLLLMVWQWPRVDEANGLFNIITSGVRVDVSTLCSLLIIPALVTCFLSSNTLIGRIWNHVLRVWVTFTIWLIVYMEVVTVPFIIEYDLRPNRLFIEYLIYPKEVFGMLFSGYKLELFIGLLVTIVSLVLGWKFSRKLVQNIRSPKWYTRFFIALLVLLLGALGSRSSLGHRPMNPAMVAFSTDPLINDLVLNSSYSLGFSYTQMKSEANASKLYPKMSEDDIIAEIRKSMNVSTADFSDDDSRPTLASHLSTYQGKPKNIVILLLESHGARYVSKLNGINVSPNMDTLIEDGWAFTRLYASGTRSVRGIEAVTTGFPPTPARSTVKLGKSQTGFFTLADVLKKEGYHTQFVYGGESHFDNMKSFFLGNGFTDMQDLPTFESPEFVGSWGASDEDLYKHAHDQFTKLHDMKKPFFSLVFSSSNHSPFDYPANKIEHYNEPQQTVENAVKYADFALGKFIDQAKKSNYWDDTVFVVVADHDARTWGKQIIPIDHFHIPAIIFGKDIEPRLDDRLVSQLDLAPTLLSLAGISVQHPMIGHDLTHDVLKEKQRAMMQRDQTFAWMTAEGKVVVFVPQKPPQTYLYDSEKDLLIPSKVDEKTMKRANANALWGSLSYGKNYYKQLESYSNN